MNKRIITLGLSGKKGHGKDTLGSFLLDSAERHGWSVVRRSLADPLKDEAAYAIAIFESHFREPMTFLGYGSYIKAQEQMEADFDAHSDHWEPLVVWLQSTYDLSASDAVRTITRMCAAALSSYDDSGDEGYNEYDRWIHAGIREAFDDPRLKYDWRILLQWWGTEFRRRLCGDDYWLQRIKEFSDKLPDNTVHGIFDVRFPNEFSLIRNTLPKGFLIRVERPDVGAGDNHISETALDHLTDEDWNAVVVNNVPLSELAMGADIIFKSALLWSGYGTP